MLAGYGSCVRLCAYSHTCFHAYSGHSYSHHSEGGKPHSVGVPTVAPSATQTSTATVTTTPLPTAAAKPTTPATSRPSPKADTTPRMEVLRPGFGNPYDIAITPAGDIVFGDFTNQAINIFRPGGTPTVIAGGFKEPEGIVIALDGVIIHCKGRIKTTVDFASSVQESLLSRARC